MVQIMQQPIQFRIFSTISLNRKFLFEVFSVSASYIIVLIQYEHEVKYAGI